MLGTTVPTIIKVITKVSIRLYVSKIMLTYTVDEYELEVAHSAPSIITVTRTIGLAIKPSQT